MRTKLIQKKVKIKKYNMLVKKHSFQTNFIIHNLIIQISDVLKMQYGEDYDEKKVCDYLTRRCREAAKNRNDLEKLSETLKKENS